MKTRDYRAAALELACLGAWLQYQRDMVEYKTNLLLRCPPQSTQHFDVLHKTAALLAKGALHVHLEWAVMRYAARS